MAFFKFRKRGQPATEAAGRAGAKESAASPQETIDSVRRRARHRLVGAAVLVLLAIIGFPLLFDTQPRPVAVNAPITIPDKDKAAPLKIPDALPADASLDDREEVVAHGEKPAGRAPVPVPVPAPTAPARSALTDKLAAARDARPDPAPDARDKAEAATKSDAGDAARTKAEAAAKAKADQAAARAQREQQARAQRDEERARPTAQARADDQASADTSKKLAPPDDRGVPGQHGARRYAASTSARRRAVRNAMNACSKSLASVEPGATAPTCSSKTRVDRRVHPNLGHATSPHNRGILGRQKRD